MKEQEIDNESSRIKIVEKLNKKSSSFPKDIKIKLLSTEMEAIRGILFLQFSHYAYLDRTEIPPVLDRENENFCHSFKVERIYESLHQTIRALIFKSHETNEVVVAFKGTKSLRGVGVDAQFLTKYGIHYGFLTSFQYIEPFISIGLKELMDQDTKLYFTGHSMGGAMAMLAAFYYASLKRYFTTAIYTFGAPRVGTKFFTKFFHAEVPEETKIYRYVTLASNMKQDPITRIPAHAPKLFGIQFGGKLYEHVRYDTPSIGIYCPAVEKQFPLHFLKTYREGLKKILPDNVCYG